MKTVYCFILFSPPTPPLAWSRLGLAPASLSLWQMSGRDHRRMDGCFYWLYKYLCAFLHSHWTWAGTAFHVVGFPSLTSGWWIVCVDRAVLRAKNSSLPWHCVTLSWVSGGKVSAPLLFLPVSMFKNMFCKNRMVMWKLELGEIALIIISIITMHQKRLLKNIFICVSGFY